MVENWGQSHLGRLVILPHFSMQNLRGPLLPLRAEKPSYGMLEVPVTNWNSPLTFVTFEMGDTKTCALKHLVYNNDSENLSSASSQISPKRFTMAIYNVQ